MMQHIIANYVGLQGQAEPNPCVQMRGAAQPTFDC
jgi:hypothetical protein